MKVQQLSPDVIKKLRTDVAFCTVAQCVEELVWNSIDAASTCIAVRLNLAQYKIQVVDNGNGIPKDELNLVGERYTTSKCHTVEDLECLRYSGFRGEALSSLKETSLNLMIDSRASTSEKTYCKIFTLGRAVKTSQSLNPRPSKGTTVTVFDFMHNRPVRKLAISEALDLEETHKLLQSIALVHTNISFSLLNETTGANVLQFRRCATLPSAFTQLFGRNKAKNLKPIANELECYKIDGFISTDCFQTKELQFLYVNKHLIIRTNRLHKLINRSLSKWLLKKKCNYEAGSTPELLSPSKNQAQYCCFVINIVCPLCKYDSMFDRRNTVVEFSEWDKVSDFIENSILKFLKEGNLISDSKKEEDDLEQKLCHEQKDLTLNLGVDNYKSGLFSHLVKRREVAETSTKQTLDTVPEQCEHLLNAAVGNRDVSFADSQKEISESLHSGANNPKHNLSQMPKMDINLHYHKVISLKDGVPCTSILDKLKRTEEITITTKGNPETDINTNVAFEKSSVKHCSPASDPILKNHDTSVSEIDIPSRSVFPTENPIMLRVPVKSNLSLLEVKSADSKTLQKLKEKYKFIPSKQKLWSTMPSKYTQEQPEELHYKSQCLSEKMSENKSSCYSSKNDNAQCWIDAKKSKSMEKDSFQQISLSDKTSNRIISKYTFNDDLNVSPLKRLRHSKKPKSTLQRLQDIMQDADLSISSRTFKTTNKNEHNSDRAENLTNDIQNLQVTTSLLEANDDNNWTHKSFVSKVNQYCNDKKNLIEVRRDRENEVADRTNVCTKLRRKLTDLPLDTFNKEMKDVSPAKMQKLDEINIQNSSTSKDFNTKPESNILPTLKNDKTIISDPIIKVSTLNQSISNLIDNNEDINACNAVKIGHNSTQTIDKLSNSLSHSSNSDCLTINSLINLSNNERVNLDDIKNTIDTSALSSFETTNLSQQCANLPVNKVLEYSSSELNFNNQSRSSSSNNIEPERDDSFPTEVGNISELRIITKSPFQNVSKIPIVCSERSKSNPRSINAKSKKMASKCSPPNIKIPIICTKSSEPCFITKASNSGIKEQSSNDQIFAMTDKSLNLEILNSESDVSQISLKSQNHIKADAALENCKEESSLQISDLQVPTLSSSDCFSEKLAHDENIETVLQSMELKFDNEVDIYVTSPRDAPETERQSRWVRQVDQDTNRVSYIDTFTGNSTFITPQLFLENSNDANAKADFINDPVKKRHFFLTHDFSPFVKDDINLEEMENSSCEKTSELKAHLNSFINETDKNDLGKKWRHLSEENCSDENVQDLLDNWKNPMFEIPSEVNDIEDLKMPSYLTRTYTINSYRFSKATLNSLKVIGQVDCKFIACILENVNENVEGQKLLALFDQHAVHERIRLEELVEDLYESSEKGKRIVKSSTISPSIEIMLEPHEMRLLSAYHACLKEIGIHVSVKDEISVEVFSIPSCLVDQTTNQLKRRLADVLTVIERSIKEFLVSLTQSRSVSSVLPKTLSGVLNAQACRSAVKFGDPLTYSECEDLLTSLSKCKLPFQCAHGRPSITPILDLNKIDSLCKKRPPPQIRNLKRIDEDISCEI